MTLVDVEQVRRALSRVNPYPVTGRVTRATGLVLEARLPGTSIGTVCEVELAGGGCIISEVIGLDDANAKLMPVGSVEGVREGAAVVPRAARGEVQVSGGLLGRVVDADLSPVDGKGPLSHKGARAAPLRREPPPAMRRQRISRPLETGVRVIDTLLTLGEGQRIGIFAGPGVGKSVLLGMLARSTAADVVVVGLVGERGREVREFVERDLGPGLKNSVVVVATADATPLLRVRATLAATAAAEYFRDRGLKVLFLVDSLTRFAMAHRELGLAAGEPPTSRGYPPTVYSAMARLVERTGPGVVGSGSITAIYTVLAEGDDLTGPIADAARGMLDGHFVLSRELAGGGHFPAVDVLDSVSRVMTDIIPAADLDVARRARQLLADWRAVRDLVEVGGYVRGTNPRSDRAIDRHEAISQLLRQGVDERARREDALHALAEVLR